MTETRSDPNRHVRKFLGVCTDGLPFITIAVLATIFVSALWGYWGAPLALISVWMVWFFRDPARTIPSDPSAVVSPADGKVIAICRVPYPRLLNGEATRVSIFMNVFNVHVNRVPFSGVVRNLSYNPGRFMVASHDKASLDNEQMAVVVDTPKGGPILFVQIAGLVARRIVCRLREGESVERGLRFGLIRFGSRCDVYLPDSVEVSVGVGDRSIAGQTVLGRFK